MPGGVLEKARRWGVSKSLISNWQRGESVPHSELRDRIYEAGGPTPEAWDEAYVEPAAAFDAPTADEQAPEPASADVVAEAAAVQLRAIRQLQRELGAPGGMADMRPDEKVRLQLQVSDAIGKLSAFTGVKLTHRMILASPLWAEVRDAITVALEPWPDAMRAVAETLEKMKVA